LSILKTEIFAWRSSNMPTKNATHAEESAPTSMNRRKVLLSTAAVAAAAVVGSNTTLAGDHSAHSHGATNVNEAIIDSALNCMKTGQACIDHCIELFKSGDTSVANCADNVQEMLAMCHALSQMASYNSTLLGELANICRKACLTCEKECKKHAAKHTACKACAESCERCAEACKKIIA